MWFGLLTQLGRSPWCVSVNSQASLREMCTGLKLAFPLHGLKYQCVFFTYNCRWKIEFFLAFKNSYSKVIFDYLINTHYIENLEGVLFTRGVDCGVWGFLFVGFGFFAGFFCCFAFYCTLSRAHWPRFCSGV